jgi:hypothetical protein
MVTDNINPDHYRSHPSGVECIQVTEHLNFCIGNAIKYLWRAGLKGDAVEDLRKAAWYIDREIKRLSDVVPSPTYADEYKIDPTGPRRCPTCQWLDQETDQCGHQFPQLCGREYDWRKWQGRMVHG